MMRRVRVRCDAFRGVTDGELRRNDADPVGGRVVGDATVPDRMRLTGRLGREQRPAEA